MGVVSGLMMAYEFGTNWARFSDKVGPVVGPLMGYEVLTAFFLESGFLGIMLFGRERVGRGMHLIATMLVAIGTLISAFWILAANSWMQTPQGYTLSPDGRFLPADWWQIIFNPSFPYRLVHMVIASYLSVAFLVGAVAAFHLRRDGQNQASRLMFSMAMWMAVVVAPIQILAGRPARTEHVALPAGQGGGTGGRLEYAAGHPADLVRHARHANAAHRLGGGGAASRRADSDA